MSNMNTPRPRPGKRRRSFREVTGVWQDQDVLPFAVPDLDHDVEKGMCITVEMGLASVIHFVPRIYHATCEYLVEVSELIDAGLAGNRKAMLLAERRLHFPEVAEIRFGYTRVGHAGKGVGKQRVSRRVFEFMTAYKSLRETCAIHPDAIQLIPLLGMDRVSDAMANIAKEILIEFTQWCAEMFAFDRACMKLVEVKHVWIRAEGRYRDIRVVLPVDDDERPIILVPKEIVRSGPAFSSAGYVEGIPPVKGGGALSEEQKPSSKHEVLDDAEHHSDRLSGYVEDRLKKVGPRREFRQRKERKKKPE